MYITLIIVMSSLSVSLTPPSLLSPSQFLQVWEGMKPLVDGMSQSATTTPTSSLGGRSYPGTKSPPATVDTSPFHWPHLLYYYRTTQNIMLLLTVCPMQLPIYICLSVFSRFSRVYNDDCINVLIADLILTVILCHMQCSGMIFYLI